MNKNLVKYMLELPNNLLPRFSIILPIYISEENDLPFRNVTYH